MGLFDFLSGKNKKVSAEDGAAGEKAPVNQILSQPEDRSLERNEGIRCYQ